MNKQIPTTDQIAAIIPRYTSIGDSTVIITIHGKQEIINTRIRTVLNQLARRHATDLTALKQKATLATEHSILQPLSLAPGLVLCPIKLRIPRVAGDTSIGYINFHAVTKVTSSQHKPYQSLVTLTGDTQILTLWKATTVKEHFQQARLTLTYSASAQEIPPEVTLVSQKFIEVIYTLFRTITSQRA